MACLSGWIGEVAAYTPEAFASLGQHVKDEWIVEALASAKGVAKMRRRKLPADRTLWLVIGMALFRDRSIHEVAEHLNLALPDENGASGIAGSAIPKARERLGVDPVERLFEVTARHWAEASAEANRWRGLKLFGIDGVCLRVPDTPENEEAFGRPGTGRSVSGYPQVRVVALMALRSHVLARMRMGAFREGEQTLVDPLWGYVSDHSMTLLDRGFLSWWALWRLQVGGVERHWTVRAKSNLRWRTVRKLGRGDELIEIDTPGHLRKKHPEMPESFQVRVVQRRVRGYRPHRILTSALDPKVYPASELAALYHERWELELAYDEIKTHMLERQEALRSKKPAGVRQEVAGIGIAYNLVRVAMERVAQEAGFEPRRISFLHTLHYTQNFCLSAWSASPGVLPRRVAGFDRRLRLLVLPERRERRRYPRHVKVKMSNYARNRGRGGRPK